MQNRRTRIDRRQFLGTCAAGRAAAAAPAWASSAPAAAPKPRHPPPLGHVGPDRHAQVGRRLPAAGRLCRGRLGRGALSALGPGNRVPRATPGSSGFASSSSRPRRGRWRSGSTTSAAGPAATPRAWSPRTTRSSRPQLLVRRARRPQPRSSACRSSANLLMPEATQRFLAVTHERYAAAIGEYFGTHGSGDLHRRAVAVDAASAAASRATRPGADVVRRAWTAPWAAISASVWPRPAAAWPSRPCGATTGPPTPTSYHDAWTMPIARWCRSHKIAMSGHLLGEGSFGSHVCLLRQPAPPARRVRHPRHRRDQHPLTRSTAARRSRWPRIAEYPGRERMVEVFALGPCHMRMETMRKMVDLCASCGVDRYVMAICPHDLRGNFFNRQVPGRLQHAAAVVPRLRPAVCRVPGRSGPACAPGPAAGRSLAQRRGAVGRGRPSPAAVQAACKQISKKFTDAAREVIRARLTPPQGAVARNGPPAARSSTPRGPSRPQG